MTNHGGQHPDCYDCGTATCPDCQSGKHRNCYGSPCACPETHPAVTA